MVDKDNIIKEYLGISKTAPDLTPMDKGECKILMDAYYILKRREMLIAFFESVDAEDMEQQRNSKGWKVVDRYLNAIDEGK